MLKNGKLIMKLTSGVGAANTVTTLTKQKGKFSEMAESSLSRFYANSTEQNKAVAAYCDKQCLLSFSMGKDSIGAWIELKRYFDKITLVYLYLVPDLEFVEESLFYYEEKFKQKIIRMPHPSLYRMLNNLVWQTPERINTIQRARLPKFDYDAAFLAVKEDNDLPIKTTFTATGVRSADSLNRHSSIKVHGSVNTKRQSFFPIYDWLQEKLYNEIKQSKIKLPIDYRYFGRTFDGIDYRFLKPIKEYFPKDYQKILEWFPLADLELFRYERRIAYHA